MFAEFSLLHPYYVHGVCHLKINMFNVVALCNGDVASKSVQKVEYEFEVKDARELIDQVLGGYRPTFETYRPVPKLMELMTKCWSADMSKRPTAKIAAIELGKAIKS